MPKVCLYFHVHQPYRLRPYGIFDVGQHHDYFDESQNREICRKVAQKCYLPANKLMLKLLKAHPAFRVSYSISGVMLEQFESYAPEVLQSFQELAKTGRVEFIAETYYHSLASLFSPTEFQDQVRQHAKALKEYFRYTPKVFRNTELIYSDDIASQVASLGYKGILTEGADHVLGKRSPNQLYHPSHEPAIKLLLKNYRLSDDIAFRFSDHGWAEWPLTAPKFASWLQSLTDKADVINLFMDYETIGEHQWASTGIFDFFRRLPEAILANPGFSFATPSEVIDSCPATESLSVPTPISWADQERDVSAWLGNPMQDASIAWLYSFEKQVRNSRNRQLIDSWRKLQTSDHFYYMCTKFWSDGDVHKYFSAYETPQESFAIMNNVLADLEIRLKRLPRTSILRKKTTKRHVPAGVER